MIHRPCKKPRAISLRVMSLNRWRVCLTEHRGGKKIGTLASHHFKRDFKRICKGDEVIEVVEVGCFVWAGGAVVKRDEPEVDETADHQGADACGGGVFDVFAFGKVVGEDGSEFVFEWEEGGVCLGDGVFGFFDDGEGGLGGHVRVLWRSLWVRGMRTHTGR